MISAGTMLMHQPRRRHRRRHVVTTAITAVVTAAVLASAGCSSGGKSGDNSVIDKASHDKTLTIGVKYDQPGLSYKTADGKLTGFSIDVARYIASKLGVPSSGIKWKEVVSSNRETFIQTGQVDLVVETYSITKARAKKVAFAGPYFLAHQRLLVRENDTSITGPSTLAGKRLCSIAGSTPAQNIKKKYPKVQLQEYTQDAECVTALINGALDAMTTDDVILAGYAAQHEGKLKVVGPPMSDENYGIGVKKSDTKAKDKINDILSGMIKDGTWKQLFQKNIPNDVYTTPAPPTIGKIVGEV